MKIYYDNNNGHNMVTVSEFRIKEQFTLDGSKKYELRFQNTDTKIWVRLTGITNVKVEM